MQTIITEYPQFFTAANLECPADRPPVLVKTETAGKKLLKPSNYKNIVIRSMLILVKNKKVRIFSLIITENHIHLVWQMFLGHNHEAVQSDLLKYTAQRIKKDLIKSHPAVLEQFRVNAKDREYHLSGRSFPASSLYRFKR